MFKKALLKDTRREIKKSFGRFISIFAIVGIGVAFFAGVKDSVPVMKNTADKYFDDYNFMDLKVMSPTGMSKADAQAIQKTAGVEGVYASHSLDALSMKNNAQTVFKLMSYPMGASRDDVDYINQLRLVKGRLPQKADECVVEYSNLKGAASKVGEKITFSSGTEESLSSSLNYTTYTVVGEVTTPNYISFEKGSTNIGSGKIDTYAFLPDINFKSKYYSEIYVTIQGAKAKNAYQDDYFNVVDSEKALITALGDKRTQQQFDTIKKDAIDKIDDGRKTYDKNKKNYDDSIATAKQKLSSSHDALLVAQATLDSQKSNTETMLQDKAQQLKKGEDALQQLQTKYGTANDRFKKQQQQNQEKRGQLQTQLQEAKDKITGIDEQAAQIDVQLADPALSDTEKQTLKDKKASLESTKRLIQVSIDGMEQQLSEMKNNENKAQAELNATQAQIGFVQQKVSNGQQQLSDANMKAEQQLQEAQQKITSKQQQLKDGQTQLAKQEKDGSAKLREAKEKLDRNEEDIHTMKTPKWIVLNRHSHYSYMDYGSAADRMGAIAKVFPLFFFLVAALVCLTTMTRMVDEQRQEIGTLKALGYSKGNIAMKFIAYAAIASILGGLFGAIIGMIVFPTIIFNAWGIMYTLPSVSLQPDIGLAIVSIGLASLITIAAAIGACYKELIETPALLMRPKIPKNGKRIFLERIPILWKHFSFIYKVTARNIFRYKKRFLMTVIGISGCSALLVAGFGIQDSIGQIAAKQYGEIYKFDMSLTYKTDDTLSQKEDALAQLKHDRNVKNAMAMAVYHGFYGDKGEDKGIDIYVPINTDNVKDFITLRTRTFHTPLVLNDEGAIITEKLAKKKKLTIGDSIAIDNGDGVKKDVKISGITENYVGHAIYMTPSYYKNVYHETPQETMMFALLKDKEEQAESAMGKKYISNKDVASITFYSGLAKSFEDTISSLSLVIVVLIISAGLLAFVVLYNLTNVNISERLREIATIKVLGFYDKEVSAYVYRENIFLTIIGSAVGLLLGIGLHALIMNIAETDTIMFGRNINILSFVYAFLITMVFAIMVNLFMYRKLKQIPMVESLKSVE